MLNISHIYNNKGYNFNALVGNKEKKMSEISFGRKFNDNELKDYTVTIREALDQLGKNNIGIIAHAQSLPSKSSEDVGIGSPYSDGAKDFMNFMDEMGFNCLQLGPSGKTKRGDASPYTSTIFSTNPLFVDLKALTSDKWNQILSEKTFDSIVENNPKKDASFAAYEYSYDRYDEALREAFNNFENLDKNNNLKVSFEQFKKENATWLDTDALYEALSQLNQNDYWPNWPDNMDKNLIRNLMSTDKKVKAEAEERKAEIENHPEVEFYKFCQFVLNEQKKEDTPIKTIADIQVTYSDRDWWAYQNLFLDDYSLGVPPDYFSKNGQAWGFPAINPDKLFEVDQSGKVVKENGKPVLGEAGKLIKSRFSKMFKENPGGVRIDHILGLIDPWVYPKTASTARAEDGGARLFSSPEAKEPFKSWSNVLLRAIDPKINPETESKVKVTALTDNVVKKYGKIIDLIIEAAQENNVPLSNIICEDLGTLTNPTAAVMKNKGLSGLRVTEFVDPNNTDHLYRGKNIDPKQWAVTGTHDNDTLINWAEDQKANGSIKKHSAYLVEDLKIGKKGALDKDMSKFITAKFAELFASPAKNVQIMFMDVLGMKDRYNNPGASTPDELAKNWRLRIPNNFKDFYFEQLANNKGLNLPEALEIAIKSKDAAFKNQNRALLAKLDNFAQILKEPCDDKAVDKNLNVSV